MINSENNKYIVYRYIVFVILICVNAFLIFAQQNMDSKLSQHLSEPLLSLTIEKHTLMASNDEYQNIVHAKDIVKIWATADSLHKIGHKKQSYEVIKKIIDFYSVHGKACLLDDEICRIVFEVLSSYGVNFDNISVSERINYLSKAINIVKLKPAWVNNYHHKQIIISTYTCYIGYLIEAERIPEAQSANQDMLRFAEQYYIIGLSEALLTASAMNSLMGKSEQNISLYRKLYEMFNELDKIQQYKVVKQLIHFEYMAKEYDKVISLAIKHTSLIQNTTDDIKEPVLDLIGFSFEKHAFAKEDAMSKDKYSLEVDEAYAIGYNWTKINNEIFSLRCITNWAYYKYQWEEHKCDAILLFYELLDILQRKNMEEFIFDKYIDIEDAQQAIISIIVTQIFNSSTPIDIKAFIEKYNIVFDKLITSQKGEYYNDLIKAIETAYFICYGENTTDD